MVFTESQLGQVNASLSANLPFMHIRQGQELDDENNVPV